MGSFNDQNLDKNMLSSLDLKTNDACGYTIWLHCLGVALTTNGVECPLPPCPYRP